MVVCLWKAIYGYREMPHQIGTNNRGLKPMFSENHEIWHRDTVKIRKRAKFEPCNLPERLPRYGCYKLGPKSPFFLKEAMLEYHREAFMLIISV